MDLKPQQRVKLKGAMPPNTIVNGLADMAADLVADPSRKRMAVIIFDAPERHVTSEVEEETGEVIEVTVPTIHVRAIEEIAPSDKDLAARMMGRAREHRQARDRNIALALFETDAARYGAAGLLEDSE